jgi:mannose-6-phosphate isomerase
MQHPATAISPEFVYRTWGRDDLSPLYPNQGKRIGEVWFKANDLLIKFLFTSEPLSVQVHPKDGYARLHHNSPGKTEMWHILATDAGAKIALGFNQAVTSDQVRAAAIDGSIESLLGWFTPQPGDTYFTPAGVVHAIGAGLVLCEIQQNSDITYRLYDYNRGRELHLDRGMEVSDFAKHPGKSERTHLEDGIDLLVSCEYFRTELYTTDTAHEWQPESVMVVLQGTGQIGDQPFTAGEVWTIQESCVVKPATGAHLLRCTGKSYQL